MLRRQRDPPDQDAILIIRGDKVHEDVKSEDRQGEDRPPIQERTEDIGGVREAEFEGDARLAATAQYLTNKFDPSPNVFSYSP